MKILATDMDGTFLDHLGAYDKARLENLLDACEAKDYVFTVASGRASWLWKSFLMGLWTALRLLRKWGLGSVQG